MLLTWAGWEDDLCLDWLLTTCLAGSEGIGGTTGVEGFYYVFWTLGCSGIVILFEVIVFCGIVGFGFVWVYCTLGGIYCLISFTYGSLMIGSSFFIAYVGFV